jgi:hypothetical protein
MLNYPSHWEEEYEELSKYESNLVLALKEYLRYTFPKEIRFSVKHDKSSEEVAEELSSFFI